MKNFLYICNVIYTDMETKFETFKNKTDFLMSLLQKRLKFLKKFSAKEQKEGYKGLKTLDIENNSVIADGAKDCRFIISDKITFYVVGSEGEDKVVFNLNTDENIIIKEIKKHARTTDCGGLK